jgi:hypothetical protein
MRSRALLIGGAAAGVALGIRVRGRRPRDGVHELREELRRELERLADADVKASRTRRESASPPG